MRDRLRNNVESGRGSHLEDAHLHAGKHSICQTPAGTHIPVEEGAGPPRTKLLFPATRTPRGRAVGLRTGKQATSQDPVVRLSGLVLSHFTTSFVAKQSRPLFLGAGVKCFVLLYFYK